MPDDPSLVVINTTPVIALSIIGQLELLHLLYVEVLMPPAVEGEILAGGPKGVGREEVFAAAWIKVTPLEDPRRADLLADLDRGEAEVIALALEKNCDLVIIDERLARRHAQRMQLKVTGTIGVLLRAKQRGFVPSIAPLIERLRDGGIHLSDSLVEEALRLAGEL